MICLCTWHVKSTDLKEVAPEISTISMGCRRCHMPPTLFSDAQMEQFSAFLGFQPIEAKASCKAAFTAWEVGELGMLRVPPTGDGKDLYCTVIPKGTSLSYNGVPVINYSQTPSTTTTQGKSLYKGHPCSSPKTTWVLNH